jgi:hypothetical protein
MATIHREAGFSFRVFPNDHPPAHVHAWARGACVVIELPTEQGAANVVRIEGKMKDSEVVQAVAIVQDNAEIMWEG